jgi:hypothetical protein
MPHHACANHVQVDVSQARPEVVASTNHRRVVAITPEGPLPPLRSIVLLCELPLHRLHQPGNDFWTGFSHQQVHVVARHREAQQRYVSGPHLLAQDLAIPVTV